MVSIFHYLYLIDLLVSNCENFNTEMSIIVRNHQRLANLFLAWNITLLGYARKKHQPK